MVTLKCQQNLVQGDIFEIVGNLTEASRYYIETVKAARGINSLALTCALLQLSSVKSLQGDHLHALNDIERLLPIIRVVAPEHPRWWPFYHNELAVELLALGRITEAREHSRIACSSPIATRHQEWIDTRNEIAAVESERLILSMPDLQREPQRACKAQGKIVPFVISNSHPNRILKQSAFKKQFLQPAIIVLQVKTRTPDRAPPLLPK